MADATVASVAAWLMVCASGHGRYGCLETGLAWFWSFIALIAGAGVVLGMTGGFGRIGFFTFHAVVLIGLVLARRHSLAADFAALGLAGRKTRQFLNAPGGDRLIGLGLLVILAGLTAISAWTEPAVMDALTYHLPRIGHWLQDGKIRILGTTDARLNFIAVLPEIVMAWLVGSTREGFHLVAIAQAIGGIMAVGATIGLARQSGLGRGASLMAGGLLLGMANVVVQFTTAQTDLFATGVFAASFYLWLVALQRGESSPLGALGAGLALGAKGTLFYMLPGGLLWVGWLAWHHRLPWSLWQRTMVAAVLGFALFALPGFVRNHEAYGNMLAPEAWMKRVQPGFDSISGQLQKVYWNLTSSLAQNFEPQSQPCGLRAISRTACTNLAQQLPVKDKYTLPGFDRRPTFKRLLAQDGPDADSTSFGDITLLLFLTGSLIALAQWRLGKGRLVLVWSAGVMLFLFYYNLMQQWHPFAFRYFVLVAPWVAIVAAWGIEQLGRWWRLTVWTLVAAGTLNVGWFVTNHTFQAGLMAVVQPEHAEGYFVAERWREWSQHLDHAQEPFLLALPPEKPIASFYRQWPQREVAFKPDPGNSVDTAENFVRGEKGWVIVPAKRFIGREGHVAASVWLFEGKESSFFSLAAYRTLDPGETPQSILYRQTRVATDKSVTIELLVKTVSSEKIHLAIANPAKSAWNYDWATQLAQGQGVLEAGGCIDIEMPWPSDGLGKAKIVFYPIDGQATGPDSPTVEMSARGSLRPGKILIRDGH